MWNTDVLVEAAAAALRRESDRLRDETAVRGLDASLELPLHALLEAGFRDAGFGVYRERPFPGVEGARPKFSERERCDLVLTPDPAVTLLDPVEQLRERDAAARTLFADSAPAVAASPGIDPGEAYWLEVKCIGQFCYSAGVPGPNRTYSSELLSGPSKDLIKLEWDAAVRYGGAMVVLFTDTEATARHDLAILMHKCLDRELPVSSPAIRTIPIPDLIGNTACTVCLVPLSR
jgi:hypothetical protein